MHITFEFDIPEYWDQYIWIPFKKANKNIYYKVLKTMVPKMRTYR